MIPRWQICDFRLQLCIAAVVPFLSLLSTGYITVRYKPESRIHRKSIQSSHSACLSKTALSFSIFLIEEVAWFCVWEASYQGLSALPNHFNGNKYNIVIYLLTVFSELRKAFKTLCYQWDIKILSRSKERLSSISQR